MNSPYRDACIANSIFEVTICAMPLDMQPQRQIVVIFFISKHRVSSRKRKLFLYFCASVLDIMIPYQSNIL